MLPVAITATGWELLLCTLRQTFTNATMEEGQVVVKLLLPWQLYMGHFKTAVY